MSDLKHWEGKKVLVTGAGGFIGSHLVERLVQEGADVRAMVRYNSQGSIGWLAQTGETLKSIELFQGDLRDPDTVLQAVTGVHTVFHLGAMISIPYSYLSPSEANAVNTTGTFNILTACKQSKTAKLVHTSTSEVYGTAQYIPIDEKHPLVGQSPYSASKIGADKLVESFYRSFDLPSVIVRPFNTFGPRQSARAVIPNTIAQLLNRKEIRLGNLAPTRDFTFVSDTVNGMICAAQSPQAVGRTLNLGTKQEISMSDLVRLIAELVGKECQIVTETERLRPEKSEVNRLISDNSLAAEVMGWKPKVSLREGLLTTIAWFRHNSGFYSRSLTDYIV